LTFVLYSIYSVDWSSKNENPTAFGAFLGSLVHHNKSSIGFLRKLTYETEMIMGGGHEVNYDKWTKATSASIQLGK